MQRVNIIYRRTARKVIKFNHKIYHKVALDQSEMKGNEHRYLMVVLPIARLKNYWWHTPIFLYETK